MRKIKVLERISSPEFNPVEFDGVKKQAGRTDAIQQYLNHFDFNRVDFEAVKKC